VHGSRGDDLSVRPHDVLEPAGAPDQLLQPRAGVEAIDADAFLCVERLEPALSQPFLVLVRPTVRP
jgi:hypothetical protein